MIQLPNQCYCSDFNVHPKNWKSTRASVRKEWYITYRFYDPQYKQNPKYKNGKLVMLKGMNGFKRLSDRQQAVYDIIQQETAKLKEKAYNPITGYSNVQVKVSFDVDTTTPFITALIKAEQRIKATASTKRDLRSVLRFVSTAATQLRFDQLPVGTISRKHIKTLLSQIEATQSAQSAHRFNKIRTYLMMLFKELVELEATEYNPVKDIAKKKGVQRLRKFLSDENRKRVDEHLKENHHSFWLFTHIFFHSGARLTEMMQVRRRDVNLERQTFVVTVKKGQLQKEVEKPIKNIALPFWREVVQDAAPDDYLFSKGLKVGSSPIQSFQITKRWNKYVKKELGITEDFYSLKHLNLDQTAALLDIRDAAALASHTNTAITVKHYALNEGQRQAERLRNITNGFA